MPQSKIPSLTIMIPPPRPDLDLRDERKQLRALIEEKGVKAAVKHLVDGYYRWAEDPDPASARRKRRATLIFSREELEALVPLEIHQLLQDLQFLADYSGRKG